MLVSDDAAVYQQGYQGQKCWAHLLRKMVKLVLLDPENRVYRRVLDDLLTLYRDAKRATSDGRPAIRAARNELLSWKINSARSATRTGHPPTHDASLRLRTGKSLSAT